jgi:lipopolysaccharide transport system ATP-binding protein
MSRTVICVENISKAYRLGLIGSGTLSDDIKVWWAKARGKPNPLLRIGHEDLGNREGEYLWALNNINFSVEEGSVLGIIGRNGAGKSTLLKLLSRVTAPTNGYIKVRGRIASLLEVGTGFHPELTGRENIYLNGAILGMKRFEIERKFDEILDFSEVEQFIDTPVKRYSSGMYVRLAFAVAAHLDPEILVVDEVLAVGDAEFQRKSIGKMNDVAQQGRTVLFVSHNMSSILRLTQEAIVLEKGHLALRAASAEAIDYYLSAGGVKAGERIWKKEEIPLDAVPFRPVALRLLNRHGQRVKTIRSVEPFAVEMEYYLDAPLTGLRIGIYLNSTRGDQVLTSFDTDDDVRFKNYTSRPAGHYVSRCELPKDLLNDGRYILGINASSYGIRRYFMDEKALEFNVDTLGAPGRQWNERRPGVLRPRLEWKIESK